MKLVSKQIADYFKDNADVIAVYLYGSYAVGKHTTTSDIDIGIVLDPEKIELDQFIAKRDRFLLDLSRILRKEIHLVILNIAGESLLSQVFKKGNCVFVGNKKKLTLIKAKMLLKIVDFNYYKNIMQSGFIKNVFEEKV
jgi:predicted nucleotidyltransferase